MDHRVFYLIGGSAYAASYVVRRRMLATYRKWSRPNSLGLSGGHAARAILDGNGMTDVGIVPAPGELTDHYDPRGKIIRLSELNYASPTVAAIAVSAHEAGHAIQDAQDYRPLEVRTRLAPLVAAAARFGIPAAIVGVFVGLPLLVRLGVLAYVGALLFQFLALPVEYDASRRAERQLERLGLTSAVEQEGVRSVLRSAALTYVAGVASAAGYLVLLAIDSGRSLLRRRSG